MAGCSGGGAATLWLLGVLSLLVSPAAVAGVSVGQACAEVSCFSGVVGACGSCFPTTADAFCKSPCQPSWGSLDVITCLGQGGNQYWLNSVQSLNIKCGLPPIPNGAAASSADGGLGAVPGDAATGTAGAATAGAAPAVTTPSTVEVSTAPEQSLSSRGGGESPAAAALATPGGAAAATVGVGSSVTPISAAGAGTAATGAAGTVTTPGAGAADASVSAAASGTGAGVTASGGTAQQTISVTGGAGTTGTAVSTGGAISSAIATFGCAANAPMLNMGVASGCVTSITESNACTQPCQAQFALFPAACRNTMVQDSFYGDTWAGIFKTCSVPFDLSGPRVVDTAANLAGGKVVATAASTQAASSGSMPLLEAAAPTTADQAAPGSTVLSAVPLLSAAAALLLL